MEHFDGTNNDVWCSEDYIFRIDVTVADGSEDGTLVEYILTSEADLDEDDRVLQATIPEVINGALNARPEIATGTSTSWCGDTNDSGNDRPEVPRLAPLVTAAGTSGTANNRPEVAKSWRKSAISATADAVASKFNNLRRCIQGSVTSFAANPPPAHQPDTDELRTNERRLRLEEVKFYLEWFVTSYGAALQLGRYQPGSSPELFVTTGRRDGVLTLSGEMTLHVTSSSEVRETTSETVMTAAAPSSAVPSGLGLVGSMTQSLTPRRVASEGDLASMTTASAGGTSAAEFGHQMSVDGSNSTSGVRAVARSSLTAPNNLCMLRNPRIAAAAAATVAAVNASRYRGAAGGNRDQRDEPPRPLAPPDEILRELADIRRLLLQRLVLQGGHNPPNMTNGDPTTAANNLQYHQLDMDPDDELLELLEALAEEGGVAAGLGAAGPGGEPLPHFPVGPWAWLECQVCLEPRWLYRRACCSLPACGDCLRHYLGVRVSEGVVRIACPNPRCTAYVTRDEISARLEGPLKQKFHQFLVEANADPRVKTCPRCNHITTRGAANAATAAGLPEVVAYKEANGVVAITTTTTTSVSGVPSSTGETDKGRSKSRKNKSLDRIRVTCAECSLVWCFACHSPWHEGLTCRQFRKGDRLLKTWAHEVHHGQLNAQKCPKCNVFIQRTTGCDHMHCTRCKTDFCYRCGDQLRKLRFFGDHYSKLSVFGCKFRYKADKPVQRKLIRGAVFGGKLMVAPVLGTLGACAGLFALGFGIFILPVYGGVRLYQKFGARRQHVHRFEFPPPPVFRFGNEPVVLEGHGVMPGLDDRISEIDL